MTARAEYEALARRVETEEPSRELRDAIGVALDREWTVWADWLHSLDAAVTLVPPHHCWQIKRGFFCEAVVWRVDVDYTEGSGRDVPVGQTGDRPAAALTAAALRAIAQEADHE